MLMPKEQHSLMFTRETMHTAETPADIPCEKGTEGLATWRTKAQCLGCTGTTNLKDLTEEHLANRLFYQHEMLSPVNHFLAATTQAKSHLHSQELRIQALEVRLAEETARMDLIETRCKASKSVETVAMI